MKTSFFLMLAAALTLAGTGCQKAKKSSGERSVRVAVGALQKRVFRQQIPVQGTVTPVEFATISAKISGTLEVLSVDEGDRRKKGELLFGIDSKVLKNQLAVKEDEIKVKEAALKSAELALEAAEINRHQSQQDFERAKTLRTSKAVSQANFENAETAYKKAQTEVQRAKAGVVDAESQLKQAQTNLSIARKNLEDSSIRAPFDCVVTGKYAEENEFVSVGKEILKLENPDRLEAVCFISAVYYDSVRPGQTPVHFVDAANKVVGRAVVTYKAPAIDTDSRTFKIKVLIPKTVPLVSGMLCELRIVLLERENYGLPEDAVLLRAGGRRIVYTVNAKNRAESVDVTTGLTDGGWCEIADGEKLTDRKVIVSGQTFVNNGSLLTVVSDGEKK